MLERSFGMIKSPHVNLYSQILEELDLLGQRIATVEIERPPREVLEEHYKAHKGKGFYIPMIDFFAANRMILFVYQGERIVQRLIDTTGVTEPAKAGPNTIRGKYGGNESYELARLEGRAFINTVVHRSDSIEEAEREIGVWRRFLGLES